MALRRAFSPPPFLPSSLFGASDQGYWYDNQDLSTMFQDTAGTVPVTAVEQPVGLQLDKSRGLERVDWNLIATWSKTVGDGVVTVTQSGSSVVISITGATTPTQVAFHRPMPMQHGVVWMKGTYSGGAVSPVVWNAGVPSTPSASFNSRISATNSILHRFDIASGSATFALTEFYEIRGNHRISPGPTTSRPILRARYNLLTFSEDFSQGWGRTETTVSGKKVIATTASNNHKITPSAGNISTFTGVTWRIRAKAAGLSRFALWIDTASIGCRFDLANGTAYAITGTNASASITPDDDGWYICRVTTSDISIGAPTIYLLSDSDAVSFAGNGVDGIEFDKADVRFATDANLPPYQRISAATDYDTVGFPYYLDTDGTDDWMRTAARVDFSGSDKVTLIHGLHKRNDKASIFNELSAGNYIGQFYNATGSDLNSLYSTVAAGGLPDPLQVTKFNPAQYPAPDTAIISATHDISGDLSRIWHNGVVGNDNRADKTTGNFRNDYVYFYARGGSSLRFNGRDYGQFAISRLLSDEERAKVQNVFNTAMGGIY